METISEMIYRSPTISRESPCGCVLKQGKMSCSGVSLSLGCNDERKNVSASFVQHYWSSDFSTNAWIRAKCYQRLARLAFLRKVRTEESISSFFF